MQQHRKAIKSQGPAPRTITLDGYAVSHRAMREMKIDVQLPVDTKVRRSGYLDNLIQQDHRGVKLSLGPMLGFKWFRTAAITIAGSEPLRRINKGQYNLGGLRLKTEIRPLPGTKSWQRNKAGTFETQDNLGLNCIRNSGQATPTRREASIMIHFRSALGSAVATPQDCCVRRPR